MYEQDESGNVEFPWVVFVIELLDNFVVIFFTFEFAVRLLICPNKRRQDSFLVEISSNFFKWHLLRIMKSVFKQDILRFMREPMNVIDLFAIFPFYINLVLEGLEDFEIIGKTGKIIRLVSIDFYQLYIQMYWMCVQMTSTVIQSCWVYTLVKTQQRLMLDQKVRVMRILRIFKLVRHFAGVNNSHFISLLTLQHRAGQLMPYF